MSRVSRAEIARSYGQHRLPALKVSQITVRSVLVRWKSALVRQTATTVGATLLTQAVLPRPPLQTVVALVGFRGGGLGLRYQGRNKSAE